MYITAISTIQRTSFLEKEPTLPDSWGINREPFYSGVPPPTVIPGMFPGIEKAPDAAIRLIDEQLSRAGLSFAPRTDANSNWNALNRAFNAMNDKNTFRGNLLFYRYADQSVKIPAIGLLSSHVQQMLAYTTPSGSVAALAERLENMGRVAASHGPNDDDVLLFHKMVVASGDSYTIVSCYLSALNGRQILRNLGSEIILRRVIFMFNDFLWLANYRDIEVDAEKRTAEALVKGNTPLGPYSNNPYYG